MVFAVIFTMTVCMIVVQAIRPLAVRFDIIDRPDGGRKRHARPTPLLGGLAVMIACTIAVAVLWPQLVGGYLLPKYLIGIGLGTFVLLIGGTLDDRFNLPPGTQIIFPLLAASIIVASGVGIPSITNPFGGVWQLDAWQFQLFTWNNLPYHLTLPADLFTIVWLLGMMYTTKFLDGVDGLVSGITAIGAVIIAILSMTAMVNQPETGLLSLIVAAAFLGFLLFNWHPASMFLGESGSLFAGFALGVLAIISGSKVATSLLIFALPVLDVAWVIIRRLVSGRSPFAGDRTHLHLRLVDRGWTTRQVVVLLYLLTAGFGAAGLLLQSSQKLIALIVALVVIVLIGALMRGNDFINR